MKTPVILVAAALTIAILLAASLLIATGTRGEDAPGRGETRNILVRVVRESEAGRVANISCGSGENPVNHCRAITGR
ncbi:MAG TPA: hypothetical protein VGZ92_11155 [Bradyrhizobium sp.]|jgi:hypothetical protein|nr:hypothetical protein [Bradyrhizobium sp.]